MPAMPFCGGAGYAHNANSLRRHGEGTLPQMLYMPRIIQECGNAFYLIETPVLPFASIAVYRTRDGSNKHSA